MIAQITTREEYDICISRGFQPLIDWRHFSVDIQLRVDLQREIFGHSIFSRGDVTKGNDRFYHWVWKNKHQVCEETLSPLNNYSSVYISHILTRGAHPEIGHDPRNTNILCYISHNRWEDPEKRKGMNIYMLNCLIIRMLTEDYNKL